MVMDIVIIFAFHKISVKMEIRELNRLKSSTSRKERTNKWLAEQLGKDQTTISKMVYKCKTNQT